jgi:hypothetical protein
MRRAVIENFSIFNFGFLILPLYLQPEREYSCKIVQEKDGAVAQSVEQRTENPCVAGSIPAHTTEKKK